MYADENGDLRLSGGLLEEHWTTVTYEVVEGYVLRTYVEEYVDDYNDPRKMDGNLGVMIVDYRGYTFGDGTPSEVTGRSQDEFSSLEAHVRWLRLALGATVVLPLYVLDHSGISMSAGGSLAANYMKQAYMGMDTSMCGFIYDTPETREKTCMHVESEIEDGLRGEVEIYNEYLTGQVFGFEILSPEGEHLEGCSGFLGDGAKYALDEGQSQFGHVLRDAGIKVPA